MSEPEFVTPEVDAAFAAFRREILPRVRPAGLDPVRRTVRRRRNVRVAGIALLAVVAIGVPAAALRGGGGPVRPAASPSPAVSGTLSGLPSTAPGALPTCNLSFMDVETGQVQANASQPFVIVKLTNATDEPCLLAGYPQLKDFHVRRDGHDVPNAEVVVQHGSLYAVPDPGAGTLRIPPAGTASFAVGTGTAYTGPVSTIATATLTFHGDKRITLNLPANGPAGQPIPATVTAYARGSDAGR
ncbi:DUF4232 domain-containing protein [Hamadaea tsunoensis]|uniref:DUF4232 domain-containing protein n=1 Tax=Hamadaea tsunoensis TaxID=53368 RepID=UPI0009FF9B75|nr:DUF4232 domain-containing protein [Hamadaea tsunoensis]